VAVAAGETSVDPPDLRSPVFCPSRAPGIWAPFKSEVPQDSGRGGLPDCPETLTLRPAIEVGMSHPDEEAIKFASRILLSFSLRGPAAWHAPLRQTRRTMGVHKPQMTLGDLWDGSAGRQGETQDMLTERPDACMRVTSRQGGRQELSVSTEFSHADHVASSPLLLDVFNLATQGLGHKNRSRIPAPLPSLCPRPGIHISTASSKSGWCCQSLLRSVVVRLGAGIQRKIAGDNR
jgi:hypothetical protein